jgi:hypothetical protein
LSQILIKRLKNVMSLGDSTSTLYIAYGLCREAAAEIERLQDEVDYWRHKDDRHIASGQPGEAD